MSTVVYQGLHQSRLESQLMESRTLKLKLSSPKLVFSHSLEMALQPRVAAVPADCDSKKLDGPISPNIGGWSILQSLPHTTTQTQFEKLQAGPYVHPSATHSAFWLSEKSLDLCTESLGSETGSEFIENSIFSSSACENKIPVKREQRQARNREVAAAKKQLFPPPLTTMCGPDAIHVRAHREDGRLILKASKTPVRRSCFQVDRSNGRLRLSFPGSNSTINTCSSNECEQDEDAKHTNEDDAKLECNPEKPCCSDENGKKNDTGRVGLERMGDAERTSSCCRCNESHKNSNKKKQGVMLMTSSMVKLEPLCWVASS
uniref:FAF domain-containing protein n=1 Tax=Kalanchoe fedtschenkoi TaxID=63787 RepID=A0A7N0SYJ4_KALFE